MLAACHQMLTILTGSRRRRPFFAARSRCSLPKYTAGPARPFATSSSPRLPAGPLQALVQGDAGAAGRMEATVSPIVTLSHSGRGRFALAPRRTGTPLHTKALASPRSSGSSVCVNKPWAEALKRSSMTL